MFVDNLPTIRFKDLTRSVEDAPGYGFNHIRSGLEFILKQSSLAEAKKILVPAFICPIVPEVIRRAGKEVTLGDADLKTFNMKIPEKLGDVDAVLVCHTFGSLTPMKALGVPVIEDCAHAVTKKLEGQFALYSMHKQFGNTGGGFVITREDLAGAYNHLDRERDDIWGALMKVGGPNRRLMNMMRKWKRLPDAEDVCNEDWKILKSSRLTNGLFEAGFSRFRSKEVLEVYDRMKANFLDAGLDELFELQQMSEDSVPFNFSMRLKEDNEIKRDEIIRRARKRGLFLDRLWYNADTDDLPNASLLARTVINLPLHPQSIAKFKYCV